MTISRRSMALSASKKPTSSRFFGIMRPARQHQKGLSLIAAVAMLAVIGMLMAAWGMRMNEDARTNLGERIGNDMRSVGDVVQTFIDTYAIDLKDAAVTASVNRPFDLTLRHASGRSVTVTGHKDDAMNVTIRRAGLLRIVELLDARGVSVDPVAGGQYTLRLTFSEPSAADAPPRVCTRSAFDPSRLSSCTIDTLLYVNEPVATRHGAADALVVNAALKKLGAGAGAAMSPDVSTIRFSRDSASSSGTVNPVRPHRAGIIAIRGNRGDQHQPYMQLAGGTMKGLIDMNQHDIENIDRLTAKTLVAGEVTLQGDTLSAQSSLRLKGDRITFGDKNSAAKVEVSKDEIYADRIETKQMEVTKEITFKKGDLPACDGNKLALAKDGTPSFCSGGKWRSLKGDTGRTGRPGMDGKTVIRDADIEYIMHRQDFSMSADPAGMFQGSRTETMNLGKWNKCEITDRDNLDSDRIGIRLVSGDRWEFWAIKYTMGRTSYLKAACYAVRMRHNGKEAQLDLNIPVGQWIKIPLR